MSQSCSTDSSSSSSSTLWWNLSLELRFTPERWECGCQPPIRWHTHTHTRLQSMFLWTASLSTNPFLKLFSFHCSVRMYNPSSPSLNHLTSLLSVLICHSAKKKRKKKEISVPLSLLFLILFCICFFASYSKCLKAFPFSSCFLFCWRLCFCFFYMVSALMHFSLICHLFLTSNFLPSFKMLVAALANLSEDLTQIQDLLLPTSALSYKQALLSRQTSPHYLTGQKGNKGGWINLVN